MGGLREQKLDTWAALIMNYTCVFVNVIHFVFTSSLLALSADRCIIVFCCCCFSFIHDTLR